MICALGIKKIGILLLSITVLMTSVFLIEQVFAGSIGGGGGGVIPPTTTVGGIFEPVNEAEVYGELAKQYSLWLIPAISAIAIGTYLVKRKF